MAIVCYLGLLLVAKISLYGVDTINWNDFKMPVGTSIFFELLFYLLDKFLWKIKPINHLLKIPNLNGDWSGKNKKTTGEIVCFKIKITQTWHEIDIIVETERTKSHMQCAHFEVDNKNYKELMYTYKLEPLIGHDDYGEGCCRVEIKDQNTLIGNYFSSRYRGGNFTVTRNL
jgi:hypothetical protein